MNQVSYLRGHLVHTVCVFVAFLSLFVLQCTIAEAAVVRGGEYYEVSEGVVLESDLYFFGDTMHVDGTSTKDVLAAGSLVEVAGAVEDDLTVAAGRVTITGSVDGDLRVAGGVVTLSGMVNEDVVVLAGNLYVTEDAYIAGDLLVAGDRLVVEGVVHGETEAWVRTADVSGSIQGNATFMVRESLNVRGDAALGGDLVYRAPREAFVSDTVTIAGTVKPILPEAGHVAIDGAYASIMLRILILVIGSTLLVWLFPRFSRQFVTRAMASPTPHALRGFIFLFALPVLSLFAMFTVLGLLPGAVLLAGYMLLAALATVSTPILAGYLLAQWLKKENSLRPGWTSLGAITLVLITSLPLIGWLARMLLYFLAFGTLLSMLYEAVWVRDRKEPVVEIVAGKKEESDNE